MSNKASNDPMMLGSPVPQQLGTTSQLPWAQTSIMASETNGSPGHDAFKELRITSVSAVRSVKSLLEQIRTEKQTCY